MKQLPGFARHVLGRNLASTSRPTRGWVGWVFWGPGGLIRWVLGGKFPLFWSFGWIFFWRNMKRKEILAEKWLEKGQLFSGLARSMANCRIVSFCLTRLATYQPCGMSCRYFCESSMSLILCNNNINTQDKQIKCMPRYSVYGGLFESFRFWSLILSLQDIWLSEDKHLTSQGGDSTDTDLPGCYVATSTIPTATQEGSKFTSRSMAWGVQFHRVRMEAATLKHSNSLPNKKPRKHLLHVEELRIHGLFMTYDSLLKQWWDS